MNLLIKRQNAIKSGDYYELLNTISFKKVHVTHKWSETVKTRHGIVLMPNFTDPDYEKMCNEKIYLKCAAIRFSKNNKIYIVSGKSHHDCVVNSKDFFQKINHYERGFLTNTLEYIPSLHANKIIRNYKFNDNHYNYYSHFIINVSDSFNLFNEGKKLLFTSAYRLIKKTKTRINLQVELPDDISSKSCLRLWDVIIDFKKKTVVFSEKDKQFTFSKLQKIYCELIKAEV